MEFITSIDDFSIGMCVMCFYDGKMLDDLRVIRISRATGEEQPKLEVESMFLFPGQRFRFGASPLLSGPERNEEWVMLREGLGGEDTFSQRELPYRFGKTSVIPDN